MDDAERDFRYVGYHLSHYGYLEVVLGVNFLALCVACFFVFL